MSGSLDHPDDEAVHMVLSWNVQIAREQNAIFQLPYQGLMISGEHSVRNIIFCVLRSLRSLQSSSTTILSNPQAELDTFLQNHCIDIHSLLGKAWPNISAIPTKAPNVAGIIEISIFVIRTKCL